MPKNVEREVKKVSDILSFPDKQNQLLASGKKKMAAKDYLAAKRDFLTLYEMEASYKNCLLLISAMRALGEYKNALYYAQLHLDDFLQETQGIETYGQLLLLDGQYLAVHRLIKNAVDQEKLKEALEQVEKTQHVLSEHLLSEKEGLLLRIDHTKKPVQKKEWEVLTTDISLPDFLDICKKYLEKNNNPFLVPKLFEELVRDGAKGSVFFKDKEIVLDTLPLLQDSPALKVALQVIEKEAKNPQLLELARAELTGHFALLYPILPNVNEAKRWGESCLLELRSLLEETDQMQELEKYADIQNKKEKIRQIYQNFL